MSKLDSNYPTVSSHSSNGELYQETKLESDELIEKLIKEFDFLKGCDIRCDKNGNGLIKINGSSEYVSIKSKRFKEIVHYHISKSNNDKKYIEQDKKNIIDTLKSIATVDRSRESTYLRYACVNNKTTLDLSNPTGECIVIDQNQWCITTQDEVIFNKKQSALPIPKPNQNGNLAAFKTLLNVSDNDFVLIIAYLITILRGKGPYPVLNIIGPQGSSKSTLTEIIRQLLDPVNNPTTQMPKSCDDLNVIASNNAIVCINNASKLSDNMSDAICVIATEGCTSKRQLFTNDNEIILMNNRPVIINGIVRSITRDDLLDRTITIHLPSIDEQSRKTHEEIMKKFEEIRSDVLGVLLDAVVAGYKYIHSIDEPNLPRMADFAKFTLAAAKATTIGGVLNDFLKIYKANIEENAAESRENSPIVQSVVKLMARNTQWTGTSSKLIYELTEQNKKDKSLLFIGKLPETPQKLSNELRRVLHLLQREQIDIEFTRNAQARNITITKQTTL